MRMRVCVCVQSFITAGQLSFTGMYKHIRQQQLTSALCLHYSLQDMKEEVLSSEFLDLISQF